MKTLGEFYREKILSQKNLITKELPDYNGEVKIETGRAGNNVSHSHRKTRRMWKPNIQKVFVEINGARKKMNVCTRCLRSGKVKKAVNIKQPSETI